MAERREVWLGVGLSLLLQLLQWPVLRTWSILAVAVGMTQVIYLGPAWFLARRAGRYGLARGIVWGGLAVALLNAVAYGIGYYLFFVPHG